MSAPLKMKCPSCGQPLAEPEAHCPHCHLTLRKLDLQFGAAPKHFGRLTDFAQVFSAADERKLQARLQLFHRKFPQSAFSVFLIELRSGTSIAEYTFWLANRVRFGAVESIAENNRDFLLVVDTAGAVGLTIGYGLEKFLSAEDLAAVLKTGADAFGAGNWLEGVERCIEAAVERMRQVCRAVRSQNSDRVETAPK